MTIQDKIFRFVTHWFYEAHPCLSYTWFHKGYRYRIERLNDDSDYNIP